MTLKSIIQKLKSARSTVGLFALLALISFSIWVQIRVGGSVAAAAAEGSFVVRAMQTLLAAEIREFSGSWADSAFVGLTLIYDHRERQMFRRSEDERGGEASLYHFILSLHEFPCKPLTRTLYKCHLCYRVFLQKTASSLVKSRLALGSPSCSFVRLSPCQKWPYIQENSC